MDTIPHDRFNRGTLDRLAALDTVRLTTYKRDGTPVGTPVHLVVEDGRPYFRTWETAWKARRLRRNPNVEIAPSTIRGEPTGSAMRAQAYMVQNEEAARALGHCHPILHRWLIPWYHRLRGWRTVYFRLEPALEPVCHDGDGSHIHEN